MTSASFSPFIFDNRKGYCFLLGVAWIAGLLSGCGLFLSANIPLSLMRGVLDSSVSIVTMLTNLMLPFLLSAFAVYLSQPWMLILFGYLKLFLVGYVSLGITVSFDSAGWLLRMLILFADLISLPLLFWYQYKGVRGSMVCSPLFSSVIFAICILVGCINYVYVLPFVADLIIL